MNYHPFALKIYLNHSLRSKSCVLNWYFCFYSTYKAIRLNFIIKFFIMEKNRDISFYWLRQQKMKYKYNNQEKMYYILSSY